MGSNPTNQNLTYGQGYYGKYEELGVYRDTGGAKRDS